jgi:glutamine cyclotransferase
MGSLLGKLNMRKTELNVKKKNHKIWGTFFRRPGKSMTRSFSGGIVETQDKISALTWQGKVMFTPSCG